MWTVEEKEKIQQVYDQLRDYQKDVFKHMVTKRKWLPYLDMGMGKTLTSLTAIMYLKAFPCIIVCPKSAVYVWEEEIRKWFGEPSSVYLGKPKHREEVLVDFERTGKKFIITNYSLIKELGSRLGLITSVKAPKSRQGGDRTTRIKLTPQPGTEGLTVGGLICDEIQRSGLFNYKSITYDLIKQLNAQIPVAYYMTGTPYRRGVVDFYGPLSLVDPDRFNSYWRFVQKWCVTIKDRFGTSIERNPADAVAFRAMLREYSDVLKKEDYLHELPGKIRQQVPLDLDDEQARVYKQLVNELIAETDTGELIMTPSVLSLMVRLRQLLVAPQVLGLKTRGAAIDALLEMGGELLKDNRPIVVFTPFRQAVSHIRHALEEEFPGLPVYELTGGLTPEQFRDAWQGFQNGKGARALICVIKSGASFHATAADTAFFLGCEYDFNENMQAEDRLNRMGQKNLVTCYYMTHRNTIDEEVMDILNEKVAGANLVLSNEETFKRLITKHRK